MSLEGVCHELYTWFHKKLIPNLEATKNSLKKFRYEKVMSLKWGWSLTENFPSGSLIWSFLQTVGWMNWTSRQEVYEWSWSICILPSNSWYLLCIGILPKHPYSPLQSLLNVWAASTIGHPIITAELTYYKQYLVNWQFVKFRNHNNTTTDLFYKKWILSTLCNDD
jgi:hypothetical protein